MNHSANVLVFGDINGHRKNWLTYSGETDRPCQLGYDFVQFLLATLLRLYQ